MAAARVEPAGSWHALDGRRPPHTWADQGPTGRAIPARSGPDAPHGLPARLDEAGELGRRTQAPIRHAHVTGWSARMDGLHPREIVGEEGRDDPRQEHPGARLEPPQQPRHGKAAARPLR